MARGKNQDNKQNQSSASITPNQPSASAGPSSSPFTTVPPIKKHVLYFIECSQEGISPKHVEMVEAKIGNLSGDQLFLVLHTFGGDIYSAVRIMKILQSRFKEIKVIIPDYAYSSGTIMSLGGDEIYMAVDATLGPLDKPIEHPNDGSEISSLDITQILTNLASICTSTATSIYTKLRRDGTDMKLPKATAAKIAFDTASKIVNPIIEKIDPYNLQRGFREAKIGLFYAIDMLISRMMTKDIRQAVETSQSLVDNYPSHGYGIFRDEAEFSLKLNIHHLESLSDWGTIEPKFIDIKQKYTQAVEFTVI